MYDSGADFYGMIALVFIALMFFISTRPKDEPEQSTPQTKNEAKARIKKKSRSAEVIDTLDWMLQNQIISSHEYSKLMAKCLQFFD